MDEAGVMNFFNGVQHLDEYLGGVTPRQVAVLLIAFDLSEV